MQAFLKYAKQPSNYSDFWDIFESSAKFKYEKPGELQRKNYFNEEFNSQVMGAFFNHLRLNKLIEGSSEQEITNNINNGTINHDDFIFAFSSWLDQEDTFFVYSQKVQNKPKTNPPPTPPPEPKKETQQHTHSAQYQPSNPPFIVVKPGQTPNSAQKGPSVMSSYQQPPYQIKQMQDRTQQLQFTPVHEQSKPIRVRYLQKIADFFEYPQRSVRLKNDLQRLLQSYKKN